MPRADQANVRNAPGLWYVDNRCVRCDAETHRAPGLIEMDGAGRSFVAASRWERNRRLRCGALPGHTPTFLRTWQIEWLTWQVSRVNHSCRIAVD